MPDLQGIDCAVPKRRHATPLVLVGLAVLAFAAAGAWFHRDSEQRQLDLERARRYATAKLGRPLPGTPDTSRLAERLVERGLALGAPVFLRIFKQEFELELWLRKGAAYELFATYPICRWSGALGPKIREGDRQAPEGFYTVDTAALNPASRWHRSFNLGFPNAFDRAYGRSGSFLMVHGGCGSVGCYAMTDPVIDEIWTIVTAALAAGQPRFHVHAYPFRMTEANLERARKNPWRDFWSDLKAGSDAFEAKRIPPDVAVCQGRYRVAVVTSALSRARPVLQTCRRASLGKAGGATAL